MTAIETASRKLADLLVERVKRRFWHPYWEGPLLQSPEETAAMQAAHHQRIDPKWEVFVWQSSRNSRNLEDTSMRGVTRAAIGFKSLDEMLLNDEASLAYQLTLAIGAQAAHEALEWVRFDGDLVIDPHGTQDEIDSVLDGIIGYFETAAR